MLDSRIMSNEWSTNYTLNDPAMMELHVCYDDICPLKGTIFPKYHFGMYYYY